MLDGTAYVFDVRWNTRAAQWAVDISEEDGTMVVRGAVIALGAILGRTSTHLLLRSGIIVARDTSRENVEPTLDDLGTRVQIYFFTRDEYANEIIADVSGGA